MASPRTCTHSRGFTLIELLVVLGAIVAIIGFSMFVDLNNYRGDAFRAERDTLITVLQTARADALNNVDEMPHGVAIFPNDAPHSYVIFEGTSYAGQTSEQIEKNQIIDSSYPVKVGVGSPTQIIFCQLTGDVVTDVSSGNCDAAGNRYDGTISFVDKTRGLTLGITLNHDGAISW